MGGILIAYFLILAMFHKHTNPVFSFLNAFITVFGIYETVRYYKLEQGEEFTYSKGITAAIISGFVATTLFSVFFLFYITEIDSEFVSSLLKTIDFNSSVSVGIMTFTVAVMGLATTVISALTVMQYFKKSWNVS
jgi:hypothetical protein